MEKEKAADRIHRFNRFGSILGLERMTILMSLLGNPEKKLRCIHVAGTNGKGSVCRYIYEAILANGYSAGLYTSPFLTVFNERIELNGEYISDKDLEKYTDIVLKKTEEMVAKGYDSPTEFEVITAIAFMYFAENNCDYAVLEVGLGGRGDSTNIIESPLVSIITSISYDHTDRLGKTLPEIAGEKAGIIKKGCPVIINVEDREAARVMARKAYEEGAVLYNVRNIKYGNIRRDMTATVFDTVINETDYSDVSISMPGSHQIENAMTALTAIEVMRKKGDIRVERSRLYEGIQKAKEIGRFEIIDGHWAAAGGREAEKGPLIVLDGAHNEAGAEALYETARFHFSEKRVLMVVGILADKAVDKILDSFCNIAEDFIAAEPVSERKLSADKLREMIRARGKNCIVIKEPEEALKTAMEMAAGGKNFDVILFAGSLYMIGKIRGYLKNEF